jgi:hypothetical protein
LFSALKKFDGMTTFAKQVIIAGNIAHSWLLCQQPSGIALQAD